MEDKSMCTCDDLLPTSYSEYISKQCANQSSWDPVSIDKLLQILIENKLNAIRMSVTEGGDKPHRRESSPRSTRSSERRYHHQNDNHKRSHNRHHHHNHHHYHNHHHSHHHHHDEQTTSSISKVQHWSQDLDGETSFVGSSPEGASSPKHFSRKSCKDGYSVVEIDGANSPGRTSKRKRRKKRRARQQSDVSKVLDPEDLPKRARWTIIITSGLLILTCMFLVGITLRMAPIIDQMAKKHVVVRCHKRRNTLSKCDHRWPENVFRSNFETEILTADGS